MENTSQTIKIYLHISLKRIKQNFGGGMMVELKECPFCGCCMKCDENHYIFGEHKKTCYFYFVDNQNRFDFSKEKDLMVLHAAWNTRSNK